MLLTILVWRVGCLETSCGILLPARQRNHAQKANASPTAAFKGFAAAFSIGSGYQQTLLYKTSAYHRGARLPKLVACLCSAWAK